MSSGSKAVPTMTAKVMPHVITVMHGGDSSQSHTIHCDLATLNLGQLYKMAAAAFHVTADSFKLMHTSSLPNDDAVKAIDVGLSNKMFLILQPRVPQQQQQQQQPQPQHGMCYDSMAQQHMPMHMMQQQPQGFNTSPGLSPHMMPMQMGGSPAMVHQPMMGASPLPLSPMADPYLTDYEMVLSNQFGNQMQHLMHQFSMSPGGSPPASMPLPVSPPLMRDASNPRQHRPTGCVNLASVDLAAYAMTNEGSRANVAALEETDDVHAVTAKIAELSGCFGKVASHQHGSKVVRALLRKADPEQKSMLLQAAGAFLAELCESNTGSDVYVEVILACRNEDVDHAVGAIVANSPHVAKSINGRKLIVAVLGRWAEQAPKAVEPVFEMINQFLVELAQDQTGCVTIQRCLDNAKDPQLKTKLQMQIMNVAHELFTDMYGNYVLQHAIKGSDAYGKILAGKLQGKVVELAQNKYSSCVIEKVLQVVGDQTRQAIVEEVLAAPELESLMSDRFGNFVVQSMVDLAPAAMLPRLQAAIMPFCADCQYGFRIEGKLKKRANPKRNAGGSGGVRRGASQGADRSAGVQPLQPLQPLPGMVNGAGSGAKVAMRRGASEAKALGTAPQAPIVNAP